MEKAPKAEIEKFKNWIASHPTQTISFPNVYENSSWMAVQSSKHQNILLPKYIKIGNRQYNRLPIFPFSKEPYHAGAFGVVAAYRLVGTKNINSTLVLKTSIAIENKDQIEEKEAFEVLRFLQAEKLLGANSGFGARCNQNFIQMTASASIKKSGILLASQSFIALEAMDMDFWQIRDQRPDLFFYPFSLQLIFKSIAQALACMHLSKPPIAHGDLKPANILCSPHTQHWLDRLLAHDTTLAHDDNVVFVKMADFDSSFLHVWEDTRRVSNTYTPEYISPARWISNKPSREDDIWAFGIIMLALTSFQNFENSIDVRKVMSEGKMNTEILAEEFVQKNIVNTGLDVLSNELEVRDSKVWNDKLIHNFLDLLTKCLKVKQKERITIQQILKHPFLTQITIPPLQTQTDSDHCTKLTKALQEKIETLETKLKSLQPQNIEPKPKPKLKPKEPKANKNKKVSKQKISKTELPDKSAYGLRPKAIVW